jgi:hypothetical protein
MKLMIHTIQVGDVLTMVGPDGLRSERFTVGDLPRLSSDTVWIYRAEDAPIVVERSYGLDSTFIVHSRHDDHLGKDGAHS